MQHAGRVRGAQRLRELQPDARDVELGHGALVADLLAQRAGVHELHHDPGVTLLLQDVVDGGHAGVRHPARRPGLAERAYGELLALLVRQAGGRQHLLDGHVPAEHLVVGLPHRAHAAPADRLEQPISPTDHHR